MGYTKNSLYEDLGSIVDLEWEDYISMTKNGEITPMIEKSTAMLLMVKENGLTQYMKTNRVKAHNLWLKFNMLLIISFIITGILYFVVDSMNGWIPIGCLIGFFLLSPAIQKSASEFVLEECLENKTYYDELRSKEFFIKKPTVCYKKVEK